MSDMNDELQIAVEVRPVCPACGSTRLHGNGTHVAQGIIYRVCQQCGARRKYRLYFSDAVTVTELVAGREN